MRKIAVVIILMCLLVACTTDFPKAEISTTSLEGFIVGGDAKGVYGTAGLLINQDSIQMTDWPMSRLAENLNTILGKDYEDLSEFPGFYTIQIANTGELDQIEFCDSIAAVLVEKKLIK
jgi:hypothetical protein